MVPYIGAVLAWVPAFIIALAKFKTFGAFLLIAGVLTGIHVVALELYCAATGRPASETECGRHHRGAIVLGLGLGRHGIVAGHSDHCGACVSFATTTIPGDPLAAG